MKRLQTALTAGYGIAFVYLLLPIATHAQNPLGAVTDGLKTTAKTAGFAQGARPIEAVIGSLVNSVLALIGVIFMIVLLYGGYLYLTAAGDEGKVKRAKNLIGNAVIGVIITATAYTLSFFLLGELISAVSTDSGADATTETGKDS